MCSTSVRRCNPFRAYVPVVYLRKTFVFRWSKTGALARNGSGDFGLISVWSFLFLANRVTVFFVNLK